MERKIFHHGKKNFSPWKGKLSTMVRKKIYHGKKKIFHRKKKVFHGKKKNLPWKEKSLPWKEKNLPWKEKAYFDMVKYQKLKLKTLHH